MLISMEIEGFRLKCIERIQFDGGFNSDFRIHDHRSLNFPLFFQTLEIAVNSILAKFNYVHVLAPKISFPTTPNMAILKFSTFSRLRRKNFKATTLKSEIGEISRFKWN